MHFDDLRSEMVTKQIRARGIQDHATLKSMEQVPRHLFVPKEMIFQAYNDCPLPIGNGQTISQPFIVAIMNQLAELNENSIVLDIGTGSGYAAVIAAFTAKKVYTIERIESLAHDAEERFKSLGYTNIELKQGDGSLGWQEKSPFDVIIVAAGAPIIPETLLDQLKVEGKLIIPVGDQYSQHLMRIKKNSDGTFNQETYEGVRFVPLIGEKGWKV
jgi:protein-L-isoaspartate(D-aspartate) O-methyltransferase